MIPSLLQAARSQVLHRVWVVSDLQQSVPAEARRCLTTAVEDFRSLDMPPEQIWYLGDAVEGRNLAHLDEMAAMQVEVFGSFGVPLRYVLGNHDFDFLRHDKGASGRGAVFREAVLKVPGWRTTESLESFYFVDSIGEYTVLFLSDHAQPQGRWASTHGTVHGDYASYPHDARAYQAVRNQITAAKGPVISCAHYAFAGGNRPSNLLDQILPLPANLRLHLYGHAHIGDAQWAGKDLYRKIATVDNHPLIQCDIASLEDGRGSATRSAVLEIYREGSLGLCFRNHTTRRWEEMLVLDAER
jgi:hypothetical protein